MRHCNPIPCSWPIIFSILLSVSILMVSGECLGSQQSLLLQLKNSLHFPDSSMKLVNWNKSSDCCSWEGVTCEEEGLVTHLDLSQEGISGTLDYSSVLFNLQHLKSLDLSNNYFNSTIPSRIGNLTNLSHLNLAWAGFEGQVPTEISRLRSLVTLDLSSFSLEIPNLSMLVQNFSKLQELYLTSANISTSGPLDQSLVIIQSLSVLHLEDCGLQGTFPSEIFQIPTLQVIDLSSNELLEGTLPEFPINNSLQEISLSFTKFSGRLPASAGNLWNLSTLDLSMCQFNGILPSSISNLSQVAYVDLSSNNFTGPIPSFHLSTKLTKLDLSSNSLFGEIPLSLFTLASLEMIELSKNNLSGPIREFKMTSSLIDTLKLSHNNLEGLIPTSIFKLGNLTSLDLSYNKFNGTNTKVFRGSSNLDTIDLSCNNMKSFPDLEYLSKLTYLNLSYNGLKIFPHLKNLSMLTKLDLSYNQISGEIPKLISEVEKGRCSCMQQKSLELLDLSFNQLQGDIPLLPQSLVYLDLSSNNLISLPYDNFHNFSKITSMSLSNNSLTGVILEGICAAESLSILDLSHKSLSGTIPKCLAENSHSYITLNLGGNNFEGPIPDAFPKACTLKALDLHGNSIEGEIPKSLSNCIELELLDLGRNQLNGDFPCLLKNISTLHILVFRSNKLSGSIECPNANGSWPMLQIFDLAQNNFSGELPRRWLTKLQRMMADENGAQSEVLISDTAYCRNKYDRECRGAPFEIKHYVYTVQVTSKGLEMELPKILSIFTSIDLSRNNFHGQIPAELGQLKALYILNLSYNALGGQIPSSLGNLRHLESLDLSSNNLSGRIPTQLQNLNFLSFLNLSFNQLVGMIPKGSQLQTFPEDSFIGNKGLYGCPLGKNCSNKGAGGNFPPNPGHNSNSGRKIDWNLLIAEVGLFTGFGLVVLPLMFLRRWRVWYYERLDDIILKILPLAVSRKWFQWTTT